jgi:hypothetical protein
MKCCFVLLLTYFLLHFSAFPQQNLVPNPSFEEYDTCPDFSSQIARSIGWIASTPTPDYFNICAPGYSWCTIPQNYFGTRAPASGNAYAGIISSLQTTEHREIIGTELIHPLQIGTIYYCSMKVCLAGSINPSNYCGLNKLGFLFSNILYDSINIAPVCNCAQIFSDSIVLDTLNWFTIKGFLVADSSYQYVYLGRFNNNSTTDFIQINGTGNNSYYYIDDVCISTDSNYAFNYIFNEIPVSTLNYFMLYPNPTSDFINIQCNLDFAEVRIIDLLGNIKQRISIALIKDEKIDVNSLKSGCYILTVTDRKNKINYGKLFNKL